MNIYAANLLRDVTEDELRQTFEEFGQAAIDNLNGKELRGRPHFNLPCFSIYYSNLLYGISFTLFTDNIFIKPFSSSAKIFIVVHTVTI